MVMFARFQVRQIPQVHTLQVEVTHVLNAAGVIQVTDGQQQVANSFLIHLTQAMMHVVRNLVPMTLNLIVGNKLRKSCILTKQKS
jgi:hypothetical protein